MVTDIEPYRCDREPRFSLLGEWVIFFFYQCSILFLDELLLYLYLKELESTLKQHGVHVAIDQAEQQRIIGVLASNPVASSATTSFTKGLCT